MARYTLLNLSDIHIGAISSEQLGEEFNNFLFPMIREKRPNAVFVNGDIFHFNLKLDSDHSILAHSFFSSLCNLCKSLDIKLRIIKGTLSHDYCQLNNFKAMEVEYGNLKIISSCEVEELFEDFHVLFMPEEYPTDYDNFYKDFFVFTDTETKEEFDVSYNMIVGHGEIDVAASWSKGNKGEKHYGGTPVHKYKFLEEHCAGPIVFGHIHKPFRHKKLIYPGSFSRFCHGEEDPKQMVLVSIDSVTSEFNIEPIENTLCSLYKTYNIYDLFDKTIAKTQLDIIEGIKDSLDEKFSSTPRMFRIRVDLSLDSHNKIPIETIILLKSTLVNRYGKRISFKESKGAIVNESGEEIEDGKSIIEEKYSYLRDNKLSNEAKLQIYIKETNGIDISLEQIVEATAVL